MILYLHPGILFTMTEPLVSVIIPAYNAEKFIAEAIESVITQTYQHWELLVADDGSTDNTKLIVQSFCLKDTRIKYLYQPNGRLPKARNLGLANAKGEYVAFLDADDVWFNDKLAIQVKLFSETNADMIFSDAVIFTGDVNKPKMIMNSGKGYFKGEEGLMKFLLFNQTPVLTVIMKTSVIKEQQGFCEDPSIPKSEDYHLWLRLLMSGYTLYGTEKVLAGYREHIDAMSSSDKLCISAVVEVFRDLKIKYRPYWYLLNKYHKVWFHRYHYSTNNWNREAYKILIYKNCKYLNRSIYNFFLQSLFKLLGITITRRLISLTLNK